MEISLGIGIGIGLAAIAGLRAFLPLALVGIFSLVQIFELPVAYPGATPGVALEAVVFGTVVSLLVLLALTVLEVSLDKVPSASRLLTVLGVPLGAVSGALLFAASAGATVRETTLTEAAPELLVGAVIGALVAFLKFRLMPRAESGSAGVSQGFLSAMVDIVALVGALIGLFVPVLPILPVALLLFFFYRVSRRRGRKYEGLRILGD